MFIITDQLWKANICVKTLDRSKKLKNFCLSTSQRHVLCSDSKTLQHSVYFGELFGLQVRQNMLEIPMKDYLSPGMHIFHLFIPSTFSNKERYDEWSAVHWLFFGYILRVFCKKPQKTIYIFSIVMNTDETKFDATTSTPLPRNILMVQLIIPSLTTWGGGFFTYHQIPWLYQTVSSWSGQF